MLIDYESFAYIWYFRDGFDTGPEGPELEGKQANREFKAANTRRNGLSGTQARETMEVTVLGNQTRTRTNTDPNEKFYAHAMRANQNS